MPIELVDLKLYTVKELSEKLGVTIPTIREYSKQGKLRGRKTAGKYFGRLKRFMTTVKADVEQELRADELRSILADQQKELDTLKDSISGASKEFEKDISAVNEAAESLAQDLDDTPSSGSEPVTETATKTASTEAPAAEPDPLPDESDSVPDEPAGKAKS